MQPFTFDQAIVAGLLFLLGLLIGMFLFAGNKWKTRYKAEHARARELEVEVQRLGRENREFHALRTAAERNPASGAPRPTAATTTTTSTTEHVHRDGPEIVDERGWHRVGGTDAPKR